MTVPELVRWFEILLEPDSYDAADPSRNGLQVAGNGAEIGRVAFAVDASLETIERAAAAGAGLLFVHHGLFWRESLCVTGAHYRRIKALLDANLSLYACHLPLDAHAECGNNAGLAIRLGLGNLRRFGPWHGSLIGYAGDFPAPVSLDEVIARLFPDGKKPAHILPFGPREIRTVGIVSGGASDNVHDAIAEGLDLYITGEIEHEAYHHALENGISVIACGHYQSETVGVRLVAERLGLETGVDTVFIDVPTGL